MDMSCSLRRSRSLPLLFCSPKVIIGWALILLPLCARAQGSLEVSISGFREKRGEVVVGLFTNRGDFLKKVSHGQSAEVLSDLVTVAFEQLPPGFYAISVFHDTNRNGVLDLTWLGVPKEGFAFGNNAMGMFGPPSFEKAGVVVHGTRAKQVLRLRHF